MKRNEYFTDDKNRYKKIRREEQAGGFKCAHCRRWVVINPFIGTANRNHCNYCLWSKHVDIKKGDRKEDCHGGMEPVGLTFKQEGFGRQGELMLIHQCAACRHFSINRIAADDSNEEVLVAFHFSCRIGGVLERQLRALGIAWLTEGDEFEVRTQLFGKPKDGQS
ncbi:RNHCP domain-containing protein [Streptomyces caniscabiei]|uniref:RNHCP domain-containing protein n=1 Tax=Streptomyces caniscabiei TaxID=2746961 RepID=UPI0029B7E2C7|nr:RNHCP domain-containing protein [Streptomyces caniscabiei]MDX2775747.1 RNHCP domain-containing protein [Streptomyces caniscabiei]